MHIFYHTKVIKSIGFIMIILFVYFFLIKIIPPGLDLLLWGGNAFGFCF